MVLSNTLLVTTAFELGSHCFRRIKDGNNVELNIHAQRIPALMVNPYPTNGSKGDVVMAENAATVVILVKKMGIRSESIVDATAFFVSLNALNSLKNFVNAVVLFFISLIVIVLFPFASLLNINSKC